MRLAYICADQGIPVLGGGGSSTHVRELVRALSTRGTMVHLFAANPGGAGSAPCPLIELGDDALLRELRTQLAKRLRAGGHPTTVAGEIHGLLLNQRLLHELERVRPRVDLVYERQSLWSLAGLHFARRAGIPFFLEVNAPLTDQQAAYRELDLQPAAETIERLLFTGADRVILTSAALRDYARGRGAGGRKLRVIPCGVSPRFLAAPRPPHPRGEGAFVIGFVGSLKPWHGLDLLLEGFLELTHISPAYRLLVVGDGPLRPDIDAFCVRHRLTGVVTLTGSVPYERVPEYLAQIDVGVAPYPPLPVFYFSPLKIWEYAAAGVPFVASASGDLPRLFPHKSAALLHAPGSVRKLVQHIERLRQDPELGRRLARRARHVAKRHTWDRLAARLETLAARAVAGR